MEGVSQLLLLAILGLLGGMLAGLVGVGGATIFVPTLVYVAGWGIKEAVAASLVITVFSSLSGTIRNAWSEDPAAWRVAALLASVVAPGSLIGVFVNNASPQEVVQIAFAGVLLALSYPTARGGYGPSGAGRRVPLALILLAGVAIGAFSGLVGVGGGGMTVPLMVLGFGLPTKQAVSTGLVVTLCTGVVASVGYLTTGFGDLLSLPPLILGSVLGPLLGVRLRERLPEKVIRVGFAGFMVIVALRTLGDAAGIL
jgi:uncharacterized membrane protein YfcA